MVIASQISGGDIFPRSTNLSQQPVLCVTQWIDYDKIFNKLQGTEKV